MAYRIQIAPSFAKDFDRLPRTIQVRITAKIDALAETPRPPGCQVLQGTDGLLRIRVGDYRVIYRVEDQMLLVLVLKVGHRREIYR